MKYFVLLELFKRLKFNYVITYHVYWPRNIEMVEIRIKLIIPDLL